MIEYVCDKPFIITFGHEQYPDIFQKAAVLMTSLARGHYFFDGNKRTSAMATYSFLMKNGYELIVSDDNLFNTCIYVATGDLTEKELATWLKNNSYHLK
ncbi:type II toxin-antitoxin system death-on-curing family toxin [Pseudogracilibacillus sp. SO30301A]|uniref:type II toxin-antitoxin system death-on-curing family toxin n=1 Tax=Pseudogracilibacillus sp. SO30301A TaxID=3098291 RepID=UPI00300E20EC